MKTYIIIILLFAVFVSMNSAAVAQQSNESRTDVPRAISYQAVLTDAAGVPAPDGDYTIGASLYDVVGDRSLWHDTFLVHSTRGVINLLLGSGAVPLPDLSEAGTLWLGIRIDGGEELPLAELTPAPYALTVPNGAISTGKIANGAITSEKMGADYIGSISINGQRFSTRGGDVNIIAGDGMLATVDQATNSIVLSTNGSSSSSIDGKGANSQNSNTSYIINQYGTSNIQTNATFNIDGSGAIGQSASGSHTFTVGTTGNPATSTFNGNVIVSGTHTLSVGGTSLFTGNAQYSNGLTVANAPLYSGDGSYLSSNTYIHAATGSGTLLVLGSAGSGGLYPISQGTGSPYWDGSTIQNANVSGNAFGITDQLVGDVNGNYYENFVNGINGIPISSTSPSNGQVLNYDSTNGDIEWTSGSGLFIQNGPSLQSNTNFNISGNGYIGGNVGIGTTTPQAPLDVNGYINTDSSYKIGGTTVLTSTNYTGTAANATNVKTTVENGAGTVYPVFVPNASTGNQLPGVNSGLAYNTSTSTLTATNFAGTATNSTNVATTIESGVGTVYPVFVPNASTGNQLPGVNSGLAYNTSTGTLSAGTFSGGLGSFSSSASASAVTASNTGAQSASTAGETISNTATTSGTPFLTKTGLAIAATGDWNSNSGNVWGLTFNVNAAGSGGGVSTIDDILGTGQNWVVSSAGAAAFAGGINVAYGGTLATAVTNTVEFNDDQAGYLTTAQLTLPQTWALPNKTGTLALTTDITGGSLAGSFSSSTSASAVTASNTGAQSASTAGETISNTATTSGTPFLTKTGLAIAATGDWNSNSGNVWGLTFNVNAAGSGGGVSTIDDIIGTSQNWVVTSAGAAGFSGGINVAYGGTLPNTVTNTVVFNDDQAGYLTTAQLTLPQTWTLPNKTGTLAITTDITGGSLAGSFTTLTVGNSSALQVDASGDLTTTGNILANATGTTSSAPKIMGFSNTGFASLHMGDQFNTIQSASGDRTQVTSYWGLELYGHAFGGVPSFVTGSSSDPDVNIIGTSVDAPQLRVTRGSSGQTSALQQWTSETGSVLASINDVGAGTFTAISGKVNASVNLSSIAYTVATNDMTLIVTTGSATHDILLPDPAPAGRVMTIKNTDASNGVIISAGTHSIDKISTLSLAAFGASGVSGCILIGDGTNWWIFGEH